MFYSQIKEFLYETFSTVKLICLQIVRVQEILTKILKFNPHLRNYVLKHRDQKLYCKVLRKFWHRNIGTDSRNFLNFLNFIDIC